MTSRLFGVGLAGPALEPAEREILAAHPPFGVILFRRNIETVEGLDRLVGDLRGVGVSRLLLDQEGGPVDRLRDLLGPAPSLRRAAAVGIARRAGAAAGAALARFGFDVDLAPVVDRAVEQAGALVLGERCAAEGPAAVIAAAGDFLDGLHSRGVGGCLKHFPGLGRATLDTHASLPIVPSDTAAAALDLQPFRALMDRAGAVMISHAAGADGIPASLSHEVATGLLREDLGFGGAAFSDDLEMGALGGFGDLPQRCARASAAGCDLLLVCRRIEQYPGCIGAVEGTVPAPRLAEAAARLRGYEGHLASLRAAAGSAPLELAVIRAELRTLALA